jgi:hypothetical protein
MVEELRVPWHTFDSHDPIIASPMGGVLLSLIVNSHDCDKGAGRMCVISLGRWFGWRLAATVAVEGTRCRWGGSLGEVRALTMGSYFGEIGLTID